jgi:hypothetical protein
VVSAQLVNAIVPVVEVVVSVLPAKLVDANVSVEEVAILADPIQEKDHLQCAPRAVLPTGCALWADRNSMTKRYIHVDEYQY